MAKIDRFRSPEEAERLADLKRGVNLVALATERYGLTITEKSRDDSAYTLENKAQGERITVKVGPEGYHIYNNHNDSRDKGSVVDFLQQRHPDRNLGQVKGMLQEMVPGAKSALDYEKFAAQQVQKAPSAADARYEALPPAERRAAMVRETMGPNPLDVKLTDASYLLERGLSKETVNDPAFKNRVFTDQHPERQERLGAAQHNVGFPFYNEKGVQSWELRNRAPEGETDSFKMMMKAPGDEYGAKNGVWSSNLLQGRGSQPERMILGESPIDMMSKFQTEKAAATEAGQDLPNSRYVATGGTPSIEQKAIIQAIIDREQPRQVILSNDNDAAGQAFNVRYLNDLRPPVAGQTPEQQLEAAAARERITWIAGDNGKKGDEKLLTMTISLQTGTAKEGRALVEGLRTQAEMRGLPAEEPGTPGTAGLQVRRSAPEVTEVVLRVAPAQAEAVVDLARELRREREQAMPEAARTPENYFVVEKANGKDYNQDILQAKADAQLDAARREAGFTVAPEVAPVVAVPVPEVALERAQLRVSDNEPLPAGVQAPDDRFRSLAQEVRSALEEKGLQVETSPVPGATGTLVKTYLEFEYAPGSAQGLAAQQIVADVQANAPGRVDALGIDPAGEAQAQPRFNLGLPLDYAPVALQTSPEASPVLEARLYAAELNVLPTQVNNEPGFVVLLDRSSALQAAALEHVVQLHEKENVAPLTQLQSEATATDRQQGVKAYYDYDLGNNTQPPALTAYVLTAEPTAEQQERLTQAGATTEPTFRSEAMKEANAPIEVRVAFPLDQPEVAANVSRVLDTMDVTGERRWDREAREQLAERLPVPVIEAAAPGQTVEAASTEPTIGRVIQDTEQNYAKLGYPGVATAAVGYPGMDESYPQKLVEAGATLIERPVSELAPAGTQSISYPLDQPEVVARVSRVLGNISTDAYMDSLSGELSAPLIQGVYEDSAYTQTRKQAEALYPTPELVAAREALAARDAQREAERPQRPVAEPGALMATVAIGYPGDQDFYKERLVAAGAMLIEQPVSERAPAGTYSISYPIEMPEVAARVGDTLDTIEKNARTGSTPDDNRPVGIFEQPGDREKREMSAAQWDGQTGAQEVRQENALGAQAAEADFERGQRPNGPEQVAAPQVYADIDNNGSTSAEEIIRADRNRDGVVTATEIDAARFDANQGTADQRTAEPVAGTEQAIASGPIAADINLNGSTSQDEIIRADINHDGKVTDTELAQARFEINQANERNADDAAGQTDAERKEAAIRRYNELNRQQAEAEAQEQQVKPVRDTSGELRSAGIVIFEAEGLPAGTLAAGSATLLTLAEKMKEAIEATGSEVNINPGRDKTTDQPYSMLSFTYHEGSAEHSRIQEALRDAQTQGETKFFGITPGEETPRETAPITRTVALNEQPLAIALDAPNPLLESQLRATGATVSNEPVLERPGLVVVLDTNKGEQLAGVEQTLTRLPAAALVVEGPEANEMRQQLTLTFREQGGVAPALQAEAILPERIQHDVPERLREAGATVAPAIYADRPENALSVRYPLDQPEVLGRVSVVLDEVNTRSAQVAAALGQAPDVSTGSVVETPLAQQTRQLVAKEQGLEATGPRELPERQPTEDRTIDRPKSVVIVDTPEQLAPASAPAGRSINANPEPHAVERRVILDISPEKADWVPALEASLALGGLQVATAPLEAVGEEKGGVRLEALYRTTDSVAQREAQVKQLDIASKIDPAYLTMREPEGQAQERALALKGPGKPEAGQMVAAGQTLRASITVLEVDGEQARTTRLWTDLRDAGAKVGHVAKTEFGAEGTKYAFPVEYRPGDTRLSVVSATLEAAARGEGIQVQETDNMRLERLSRTSARESKQLAEMTPEAREAYTRPESKDYSASRPDAYEKVVISAEELKSPVAMKALREELKETGALVAVQQLDGRTAGSGTVTLSYNAASPKAEAVNEVLRGVAEKGGTVYDLKAGHDRGAEPQVGMEAVRGPLTAGQESQANLAELQTLEARREALRASQQEATAKSQLAEQYLVPATAAVAVEAQPWVQFGVDLRGENLRNTDATGMDLRGANLAGQDLRSTDLRGSDLREANLRDADLRGVNLTGVRLEDAVMEGARLEGTFRVVENEGGKRQMEENLTPAQLTGPEREGSSYAPTVALNEQRFASAEMVAAGEDNSPAASPRLAQLMAPQYSGLSLPTEEEVRSQEKGQPGVEVAAATVAATAAVEVAQSQPAGLVAEQRELAGALTPYELQEEAGTKLHTASVQLTLPAGEGVDRVQEIHDRLIAAGAEVERVPGSTPTADGKSETITLAVLYSHDDRELPQVHKELAEIAKLPDTSEVGVRIVDENAAARTATVESRMENTPEAAKGLAAELHDGSDTARVLVQRPSLEDVWALQDAGAKVERLYLPDGPAALVSYPAAEPGVTSAVSLELDRIERDSTLSRPPHNSNDREVSGPLLGEDATQQERRQEMARAEGLALVPQPRYELNEMAERDARAKSYFQEEIARPSDPMSGQLANGEAFKGGLTEVLRLEQPDRDALEASWKTGQTTLFLVVQETPALRMEDQQPAVWPERVAEALREAGAETRVRDYGVSPDTGLEKHLVAVTFDNNDPALGRIQATLNRLADQDGVQVPAEGYWQREALLGPNGSRMAEPVVAERDRPWLEAVAGIEEPTAQERRELTRAGARIEEAKFEGSEKPAILVYYDLDNPATVAKVSTVLERADAEDRLKGDTYEASQARGGRGEQYQADIRQEKQQSGEAWEQLAQKYPVAGAKIENEAAEPAVALSFADRLRAAVQEQVAELKATWEATTPEKVALYAAEQQGIADRKAQDQQKAAAYDASLIETAAKPQREAEKAAYERGFNGPDAPKTPAEAEKAQPTPALADLAAAAALAGGVAAGSNGTAAEVFPDKMLRERRDDERTVPIVVDGPKEGKVLETTEQVKPGIAAVADQPTGDKARDKSGESVVPPVGPVAPEVLAPLAKAPEKELQHGIIGMESTASKTAEERLEMVQAALAKAGAATEAIVPPSRDNPSATLAYSYDPQGKQLWAVNEVLHKVEASQPSMIKEEPHSLRYAGITPNSHEIERRDWPEREGQFSKAHIVVDDADQKGQGRAERIKTDLGNAGVSVGEVKKDGHGHVELDVTYHSHSPNIEQINNTLDKAGNSLGIEVRELDTDRTARYQGAIDQLQSKGAEKERERGE